MILFRPLAHILVVGLLVLTGCMNSDKPSPSTDKNTKSFNDFIEEEENTSSFYLVSPVSTPKMTPLGADVSTFGMPNRMQYNFRVCVKDYGSRNLLASGFRFNILTETGKPVSQDTVNKETDIDGCLNWIEEIPYSPLKRDARPTLFVRKIEGRGNIRGMRRFIFELNPWSKERGGEAFIDYTRNEPAIRERMDCLLKLQDPSLKLPVCDSIQPMTASNNEGKSNLIIDNVINYDLFRSGLFNIIPRGSEVNQENDQFSNDPLANVDENRLSQDRVDTSLLTQEERSDYVSDPSADEERFAGMKMHLTLKMKILRQFESFTKGTDYSTLTEGKFKIEAYILAKNAADRAVILTPQKLVGMNEIRQGLLSFEINTILPYQVNAGRVLVAVKLTPQDATGSFDVIEDMFDVGPYNKLLGRATAWQASEVFQANDDEVFSFDTFVSSAIGADELIDEGVVTENKPYQYGMFNIKFRTVEAGETAAKRTVIFTSETQVTDQSGMRVPFGAEFEVWSLRYPNDYEDDGDDSNDVEGVDYEKVKLSGDSDGNRVTADPGGKIRFIDKMRHKYYKTERLVKRRILIKRKGDDNDPGTALTVYINPWDEKFGTFGTDARAVSKSFLDNLQGRQKIPSRFFIKDFGYETLRFRYEIDENMKLQVKKTVLFRTRPLVLRYSNILQGINSIHDLRDGIYLFKLAYQKDYLDPAASARDTVAKMVANGADPETADFNKQSVIEINSPIRPTDELDEYGKPIMEEDPSAYQMRVVETEDGKYPDGKFVTDDEVITSDIAARRARLQSREHKGHMIDAKFDPRKKQNLSIVKKLVRVNAGNIITPIEFSVDDLRLLRIRSQLFIQLEPVNQVKLQIVNMVSKLIEESLDLVQGEDSNFSCLSEDLQKHAQEQKMRALDDLARAIDDDVYIQSVDDLKEIFEKPEVVDALKDFSGIGDLQSLSHIYNHSEFIHRGEDLSEQTNLLDDLVADEVEAQRRNELNDKYDRDNALISEMSTLSNEIGERRETEFPSGGNYEGNQDTVLSYSHSTAFKQICIEKIYNSFDECALAMTNQGKDREICQCYDSASEEFQPIELDDVSNLLDGNLEKIAVASFVQSLTGETALKNLLTNDFTLNGASADISDLDFLVDEVKKGDIEKRTFVGPLTFVKNANGGSLRPTDNLDEGHCVTDDCNTIDPVDRYGSIKNFAYERSKYHGSIAHFSGVQVDDFIKGAIRVNNRNLVDSDGKTIRSADFNKYLNNDGSVSINGETIKNVDVIPSYLDYKKNKKDKEDFDSMLYHFVNEMNLNYISLTDRPLIQPKDSRECIEGLYDLSDDCKFENTDRTFKHKDFEETFFKTYDTADGLFTENQTRNALTPRSADDLSKVDCGNSVTGPSCFGMPTKNILNQIVRMPFPTDSSSNKNGVVPVDYARFEGTEVSNLCAYMVYTNIGKELYDMYDKTARSGFLSKMTGGLGRMQIGTKLQNMVLKCVENQQQAISIERKYKINETGRYYYLGGKSLNINLGQSIGISHSSSTGRNFGLSISDLIQGVPKAMGMPKTGPVGYLQEVLGAFSFSYSRGNGYSASAGTSINQGTFLVMQNAEFDVELTNYEQCITARWSEPMIQEFADVFTGEYVKSDSENDDEKAAYAAKLRRGLMICSGVEETQPVAVRETYYYFTQHFVEGDMQDRNDIHNHPWLLQLRGLREYETFLAATQSDHEQADENGEETVNAFELIGMTDMVRSDLQTARSWVNGELNPDGYGKFDRLRRHSWPLRQLIDTYRRISPTFPGLYTQLDRQAYTTAKWPWDSEPGTALNEAEQEAQIRCDAFKEATSQSQ